MNKSKAPNELNAKQRKFINEYLKTGQKAKSAVRAGYSPRSAHAHASYLLRNDKIKAELERRTKQIETKSDVSKEKVLRELALLGFSNMIDYIKPTEDGLYTLDLNNITRDKAAAIQELNIDEDYIGSGSDKVLRRKIKVKLYNKVQPLELLGKHLRLFIETSELGEDTRSAIVEMLQLIRK